jgi:hypothetical protein
MGVCGGGRAGEGSAAAGSGHQRCAGPVPFPPPVSPVWAMHVGLFRCFELVYVVGIESDLLRLRTLYRGERVYVFRTPHNPAGAQALFSEYLRRLRQLEAAPEWYHALSSNCFTNMVDLLRNSLLRDAWPDVTLVRVPTAWLIAHPRTRHTPPGPPSFRKTALPLPPPPPARRSLCGPGLASGSHPQR